MHIAEYTYNQSADLQTREEVVRVTTECETLDAIIDQWVIERSGRLSMGAALDDNGDLLSNMVAIGFDDSDGNEICCAFLERARLQEMHGDIGVYDAFISNRRTKWGQREVDDEKWGRWLESIGMYDSFALMTRIGPRSAAVPYAIAFVLSAGGMVEIRGATDKYFSEEDVLDDLRKESLTMDDFFEVQAAYFNPKMFKRGAQWVMDSVYFKRA